MIMLAQTLVPQEMKFRKKFWWSKLDDQKFRLFILKCVWKFHIQCYTFFANVRLNACSNKNANTYRLILWKLDSKIYSLFLMPYFIYQKYRIRDILHESSYEMFLKMKILFGKKLSYFNQRSCRFIDNTCCCYFRSSHSSCSDVSYSSWRHLYMCWQHLLSSITLNIEICLIFYSVPFCIET